MRLYLAFLTIIYFSWDLSKCLILANANKSVDQQLEYRPEGPLVMCKFL